MNLYEAIFTDMRADSLAVLCDGRQLSYRDLQNLTNRIANVLKELDIQSGERVAILLADSPEFIASFLAICSLQAIAVPINLALRSEAQEQILSDCTAKVTLAEECVYDRLSAAAAERLHHLRDLILVERNGETACEPKTTEPDRLRTHFLSEAISRIEESARPDFPVTEEDKPAFILYTSGSTGEPKGAVHSTADIFYTNDTFCKQILRLRAGDRLFSSSRLPFAYGLGNSFTFPLLNGVTTILCSEKPTPEIIATVLRRAQPTIFFGVPVVYTLLLEYHRTVQALDCSSLRLCVSAGEALPARLGEEWETTFGLPVLDGIGSTEMLHMWMSNREGEVRYGSSGKLLSGYDARLLDAEGRVTPPGQEGNLWVSGRSAAMGYWRRPEATARTFVDGWVRTGDLYRCDDDGYWYHMGRSDDCFKSSGQWVSPVEVEDVLLHSSGLNRAAVVEDFDENGLPCACAFVIKQTAESDSVSLEAELRELCRQMLPRHKQPRRYVFVDELPYTVTGKIQRFKLRQQLREPQASNAHRLSED